MLGHVGFASCIEIVEMQESDHALALGRFIEQLRPRLEALVWRGLGLKPRVSWAESNAGVSSHDWSQPAFGCSGVAVDEN